MITPRPWLADDEERSTPSPTDLGRLTEHVLRARTLVVAEPVSDELYRRVSSMLFALEQIDPNGPITVFINSPGGSADTGFALYDLLRFSSCPVRTIANGIVASAAVLIYLAGDQGQRYGMPHCRFLLHQPSTGTRGQASDIEITAREIVKLRERYNRIVEQHTGKSLVQITSDADRDFWLSAQEAREYGLIDRIVERRSDLA